MNSSDNLTDEYDPYDYDWEPDAKYYAINSYYCAASFFGITLNLLTIFAIGFGDKVGKQMKIQLINLAVADLLLSAIYLTKLWAEAFYLTIFTSTIPCKMYQFIALSALHASPLCSAAISIERVVIVYFPFRASQYRNKHKFIVVGIIWLCACVPEIANVQYTLFDFHLDVYHCYSDDDSWYYWVKAVKYLIPAVIVVISYTLVFIKLCLRKRSHITRSSSQEGGNSNKVLLMLVVDAFLTLITWLSYNIYDTAYQNVHYDDYTDLDYVLEEVLYSLFISNAFSTPVVYFIFNSNFRIDVRQLFDRIRCKATATRTITRGKVSTVQTEI